MFSAAILAGGESRRMGRPKALIELDGQTLIERAWATLNALRPEISEVFVVGIRPEYQALGLQCVADDAPGYGPLGGIATALRHAHEERALVVACDMPWLSTTLLCAMLNVAGAEQALVPALPIMGAAHVEVRYEPLHAIYHRSCLAAIDACLARRELKTTAFLDGVRVRELDVDWLRIHDPELTSFLNVNTPAELHAALDQRRTVGAVRKSVESREQQE